MNNDFRQEKKASNHLIETSQKEAVKIFTAAKSLVAKSKNLNKLEHQKVQENKVKIRNLRVASSDRIKVIKEKHAQEKIDIKEKLDQDNEEIEEKLEQEKKEIEEKLEQEKKEIKEKLAQQKKVIEEQFAQWRKQSNEKLALQKKETEDLYKSLKAMERNQNVLKDHFTHLKFNLLREIDKRIEVSRNMAAEKEKTYQEKRKRYDSNQEMQRKQSENTELRKTLFEMAGEVNKIKKDQRKVTKGKKRAEDLSMQRLKKYKNVVELTKQLKEEILERKDGKQLEDNIVKQKHRHRNIKRERAVGRRGGGKRWPVWVVQLICEMLTNGAPRLQFRDLYKQ